MIYRSCIRTGVFTLIKISQAEKHTHIYIRLYKCLVLSFLTHMFLFLNSLWAHMLVVRRQIFPITTIRYFPFSCVVIDSVAFWYISIYFQISRNYMALLTQTWEVFHKAGAEICCTGFHILQTGLHTWHFEYIVGPRPEIQSLTTHTNPPV